MPHSVWHRLVHRASAPAARLLRVIYHSYESESPSTVFEGLVIIGDAVFTNRVVDGIRRLQLADWQGYRLVQRYLSAIVATEKEIGFGYLIGVRFEPTRRTGYIEWDTARFAACLVRYAVYSRLFRGFGICVWRNPTAQRLALKRELHCMQLLNCNNFYIEQQVAFMERSWRKRGRIIAAPP